MALTDLNRMMKSQAIQGIGQQETMEQRRELQNEQREAQAKAGTMGAVGTGASVGFMIGGPAGAAIGGGIGLLADALF